MSISCPDCQMPGTPAGVRRHRSSAHGYPTRADFVDRFFDASDSGSAREICAWLVTNEPDGNWPYPWSQKAVSADLAQHHNYPRRHDIRCDGFGPGARWLRSGPTSPAIAPATPDDDDAIALIAGIESRLRRLRTLLTA